MGVDQARADRIAANMAAWSHPGFPQLDGEVARRLQGIAGVPSLTEPADRELMCALALQRSGGTALEVGRFAGAVTAMLALCGLEVWSIDVGLSRSGLDAIAPELARVLDGYFGAWETTTACAERVVRGAGARAHLINGDSLNPRVWPEWGFDLAFVDGGHSAVEAHNDMVKCWYRLMPRGILACHDYDLAVRGEPETGVDVALDAFLCALHHAGERVGGPHTVAGSSIAWLEKGV